MNNRGFTLIELMIVITILAVLGVGAYANYKCRKEGNCPKSMYEPRERCISGMKFIEVGDLYWNKNSYRLTQLFDSKGQGIPCEVNIE